MTLTVLANGGYVFSAKSWVTSSVPGPPPQTVPEDMRGAYDGFTSYHPDPEVLGHCTSLKSGAARIHDDAKKLSADALALAEKTTLSGTCDYTKLE